MIVETGQEAIFYASFFDPEGEPAKLVSRPTIEIFSGNKKILGGKMIRSGDRFYFKQKINLAPGKYLAIYSSVDSDRVKLYGEELLEVVEQNSLKSDIGALNSQCEDIRKLFKSECGLITEKLKALIEGSNIIKQMLAKLLPSKRIEELLKGEGKK